MLRWKLQYGKPFHVHGPVLVVFVKAGSRKAILHVHKLPATEAAHEAKKAIATLLPVNPQV